MRTCASIIQSFTERVSNREQIAPDEWIMAAQFLSVLVGEENGKLYDVEQAYVKECLKWIELGKSNAEAEKHAKVSDQYVQFMKQKSFVKQIDEMIKIAKLQARLAQAEAYGK